MIKRARYFHFILLLTLSIAPTARCLPPTVPAESVLHLVPEETLGVAYYPSLLELEKRINTVVTTLSPEFDPPHFVAKTLETLLPTEALPTAIPLTEPDRITGFGEIGLDLKRDFVMFLTRLRPLHVSLIVSLTAPEMMKQRIEADSIASTDYNGVTIWQIPQGNYRVAVLADMLLFSNDPSGCENVIDTHSGTVPSVTQNLNYNAFLTDISAGLDQFGVCFDVAAFLERLDRSDRPLAEELMMVVETLEAAGPVADFIAAMLKGTEEDITPFIQQLRTVRLRLEVAGSDVHIKPAVTFREGSEYLGFLAERSGDLTLLEELPERVSMNAAFQGCAQIMPLLSPFWLDALPKRTEEQNAYRETLLAQLKVFHKDVADRWSVSVNFGDGVLPNYLFIYDLKDEDATRAYMDEVFRQQLNAGGATPGPVVMYNRVEIKSYVFPDLKETLPENTAVMSDTWHWYYAFTDRQLLFATGAGPEPIQMVLDRRSGLEPKFADHPEYRSLLDTFGADNNIFIAISPAITAKNALPMFARRDPENAAMIQIATALLMNLPENYSLGFAAKARGAGIDARFLIKLGDFQQLIQTLQTLSQMGAMQ